MWLADSLGQTFRQAERIPYTDIVPGVSSKVNSASERERSFGSDRITLCYLLRFQFRLDLRDADCLSFSY